MGLLLKFFLEFWVQGLFLLLCLLLLKGRFLCLVFLDLFCFRKVEFGDRSFRLQAHFHLHFIG